MSYEQVECPVRAYNVGIGGGDRALGVGAGSAGEFPADPSSSAFFLLLTKVNWCAVQKVLS